MHDPYSHAVARTAAAQVAEATGMGRGDLDSPMYASSITLHTKSTLTRL